MHPDLYLVIYRQQERELEHRLEQQRSMQSRTGGGPARSVRKGGHLHLGRHRRHAAH